MSDKAGSEVKAACTKCGDSWHIVIAMASGKIAKVECTTCHGVHRYRAPGGAAKKAAGTTKKKAPARSRAKAPAEPEGPAVEPDLTRPVRAYAIDGSYQPADRVEHAKFGIGVVEVAMPGKMKVFFADGRKSLAQSRDEIPLQLGKR